MVGGVLETGGTGTVVGGVMETVGTACNSWPNSASIVCGSMPLCCKLWMIVASHRYGASTPLLMSMIKNITAISLGSMPHACKR